MTLTLCKVCILIPTATLFIKWRVLHVIRCRFRTFAFYNCPLPSRQPRTELVFIARDSTRWLWRRQCWTVGKTRHRCGGWRRWRRRQQVRERSAEVWMLNISAWNENDVTRLRDGVFRRRSIAGYVPPPPSPPRPPLARIRTVTVVADLPQIVDRVGGEAVEAIEEGGRRALVEHGDADGAAEVGRRTHDMRRVVGRVAVVSLRVVWQVRDAVLPQWQARLTFSHRHDQLTATPTTPAVQQPDRYPAVHVNPATRRAAGTQCTHEQVGQTRADVHLGLMTAVKHLNAQPVHATNAAVRVVNYVDFQRTRDIVERWCGVETAARQREHGTWECWRWNYSSCWWWCCRA